MIRWQKRWASRVPLLTNIRKMDERDPIRSSIKTVEWLSGPPVPTFLNAIAIGTLTDVIKSFEKVKDAQALEQVSYEKYIKCLERLASSLNTLNPVLARQLALNIRSHLLEKGTLTPTLDALVIECLQGETLLDRAVQLAHDFLDYHTEKAPDQILPIYTSLLKLYLKLGYEKDAQAIFNLIQEKNWVDQNVLQVWGDHLAEQGHLQDLLALDKLHSTSLSLLKYYAGQGDLIMARKYFNLIPSQQKPQGYAGLIMACAQRGLPGEAVKIYQQMRLERLTTTHDALENMIQTFLFAKDTRGCIKWFYKLENKVGFIPSAKMYGGLIAGYLASQDAVSAWKVVKKYANDFKSIHAGGNVDSAIVLPLLNDLKGKHMDYLGDRLKAAKLNKTTRNAVLSKMIYQAAITNDKKDASLAIELYKEYEKGSLNDVSPTLLATVGAIQAHGTLGNVDAAQKLFDGIIEEAFDHESTLFATLAQALAKNNAVKALEELYERSTPQSRSLALYESLLQVDSVKGQEVKQSGLKPLYAFVKSRALFE